MYSRSDHSGRNGCGYLFVGPCFGQWLIWVASGLFQQFVSGFTREKTQNSIKQSHIDTLRAEIRKARELTKGILGVNIMGALTNYADMVKTSIEEKIDIIFSGAGLPLDLPKYLGKGASTRLVPIVSSGRAAAIICNKWKQNYDYLPDAFVVEGPKAGGHLGFKPDELSEEKNTLENLVTDVLKVTAEAEETYGQKIPVIAAGGIYTGEDMFNIIKAGASAVQLGTVFVATQECDASAEFKEAYINSKEEDIKIIKSPVGMPGRIIYNDFFTEAASGNRRPTHCQHHCIKTCDPKTTLYCIADALIAAYTGNLNKGFAFAGTNAFKVDKLTSVKEIFNKFRREYLEAKRDSKKPETE